MFQLKGVYRVKGYSDKDMDLAILTLRIGGPRLLHAFSVSNYLPESSVVYKALRESISINTSFEKSLNTIISKNMNEFFMDGIALYLRYVTVTWTMSSKELVTIINICSIIIVSITGLI